MKHTIQRQGKRHQETVHPKGVRKCPVCPETALVAEIRQEVEIDYCPHCRGIWLDRGELDKIIERSLKTPTEIPIGKVHHPDRHRQASSRGRKSWLKEIFGSSEM